MRVLSLALLFCMITVPAWALFVAPQLAPVARLVRAAERDLAAHPQKAEAHYTLARVHYLAFAAGRKWILAWDDTACRWGTDADTYKEASPLLTLFFASHYSSADLLAHATVAEHKFQDALRLDPTNGLYQLGLASLQEEVLHWLTGARGQLKEIPPVWRDLTLHRVRSAYAKAFRLAMVKDRKFTEQQLDGITSVEIITALERLAKQSPGSLTKEERHVLQEARVAGAHFAKLPLGGITPIVFALSPHEHLGELLARETVVDFDLRGYGYRERWSWVKPELGLLVWDPLATGRITSARQLFGGFTFSIFRASGYDALAALDDDGDGQLAGDELAGIRVWFDRNRDGVSTPDEVVSLTDLGIVSIATTATGFDAEHPQNPAGVTLRDGRVLPTWDWITLPVVAESRLLGAVSTK